jgi:hypothetical protein
MPCYTRTTAKVNLESKGKDITRLQEAAEALGYRVQVVAGTDRVQVTNVLSPYTAPDVAALQRQYAKLTVEVGLRRFGWKRIEQRQDSGPQQIHLRARR